MHDPKSVAFEIKWSFKINGREVSLLTIWHVDPDKGGDDDSCGRFIRERHLPQELINKVYSDFEFAYKHREWFDEYGQPRFSVGAIALSMYRTAAWKVLILKNGDRATPRASRQLSRFMARHTHEILLFAENSIDSMYDMLSPQPILPGDYNDKIKEQRARSAVSVVLPDVMRKIRPWWQHPKWHIHHWQLQFHPWQRLKRRYWDKCSVCGKRGFKGPAYADWGGGNIRHAECEYKRTDCVPIKNETT